MKKNKQENRDNELMGNIPLNEYQEVSSGYSVYDSTQDYLKQQALENAEYLQESKPLACEILHIKLCKNNNIMLFVKSPAGQTFNVFIAPAIAKELGINVPIRAIYGKSPKGIDIIIGYEIDTSIDILNTLFLHKTAICTKITNWVVTEIY